MKLRKKGPVKLKIRNKQGKEFILWFNLIDYTPRSGRHCCSFCPYAFSCSDFPDPRYSRGNFNNFCTDMNSELGDERWIPIPVKGTIEEAGLSETS